VYEDNVEFEDRAWKLGAPVQLEFSIQDTSIRYNLYLDVRNTIDYPYARLFVNYSLDDEAGKELSKQLLSEYLFDQKTGEPFGSSGLGDIYDHQFIISKDRSFSKPGKYKAKFEQFMRQESLSGILAVGLRVEKVKK
jgi:gliding motility-associated lipoprotein GldH